MDDTLKLHLLRSNVIFTTFISIHDVEQQYYERKHFWYALHILLVKKRHKREKSKVTFPTVPAEPISEWYLSTQTKSKVDIVAFLLVCNLFLILFSSICFDM